MVRNIINSLYEQLHNTFGEAEQSEMRMRCRSVNQILLENCSFVKWSNWRRVKTMKEWISCTLLSCSSIVRLDSENILKCLSWYSQLGSILLRVNVATKLKQSTTHLFISLFFHVIVWVLFCFLAERAAGAIIIHFIDFHHILIF